MIDVRKYIRKTCICIAPIRIGSGTRIKILEAMAQGKPVVSTIMGCMGLEVENGKNIYITDDPKEFAAKVVYLLRNRQERIRIGKNARRLVEERYTWNQIGEKLKEVYKDGN